MSEPEQVHNGEALLQGGVSPRLTALTVDTKTGYMVSKRIDAITPQQKTLIVGIYAQKSNLSEACRAAGITLRHLRQLREADEKLNNDLHEIELGFVERAKGYMLEHMARPGNYMDRVTIARRFEPGVWGDQVNHTVNHNVTVAARIAERTIDYQEGQP